MFWTNIKRIFRAGFINFLRSATVSFASIVTITLALFVIGGLWLSAAFLNSSLADVQNKVDISVSMKPAATEADILSLKKTLEAMPEVKEITYSTREQEYQDFRKRNENNDLIIRSLDEVGNPFGARLNIRAVDPGRYEPIAKFLSGGSALSTSGESIVDQVTFKKNVVDKLVKIIATAKQVGLAITLVLVLIAVMVTFNTISLAIYISREEISLMKLVGAANNYVRGPFIVEGIIAGAISTLLALILLYPATIWVRNVTSGVFGGVNLVSYFLAHFAQIFLALLAAGVILGMVSSFLAIRKHLKI
jgi:cell division transport system permease protein